MKKEKLNFPEFGYFTTATPTAVLYEYGDHVFTTDHEGSFGCERKMSQRHLVTQIQIQLKVGNTVGERRKKRM